MNVRSEPYQIPKRNIGREIPNTLAEADKADKMLMEWKSSGMKSWAAISRRWCEITGEKPGQSTLPVRYLILKENFAVNDGAINVRACFHSTYCSFPRFIPIANSSNILLTLCSIEGIPRASQGSGRGET